MVNGQPDMTSEQLEFAIACIEGVAARLHQNPRNTYDALAVDSDLLDTYIVPCYDVLHTQSIDYVVDDVTAQMRRQGVLA